MGWDSYIIDTKNGSWTSFKVIEASSSIVKQDNICTRKKTYGDDIAKNDKTGFYDVVWCVGKRG